MLGDLNVRFCYEGRRKLPGRFRPNPVGRFAPIPAINGFDHSS
jgi:hypothetical protein